MRKGSSKKPKTDLPDSHQHPAPGTDEGEGTGSAAVSRTITSRKQALEALQESESVLRSFFDSAGVMRGIVEVIAEDDVRHITDNAVTAAFIGLTPDAMKNKRGSELGEPRDIMQMWIGHYTESQKSKKPVTFEYVDRRGETEAWLLATVTYLGTPPHGYPRFAYVVVDITGRKRAEVAQREREERYRTLFDTMLEGFCVIEMIFDNEGRPVNYRFLEVNPAFEWQTGLFDAKGKLMRDLAPDYEAHWFEIYGKIALTGEPARFENEARALNRWYEVSAFRLGGQESRRVAILFNDITERKKAEAQVIRNNKTFSGLIERAPFGIYVVDSRFRIAQMNTASQNGAFRNVRPVIGHDFAEAMHILWPKTVAGEIIAAFRHTLKTGEPYHSPRFTNPRSDVNNVESYEWELHRLTLPDGQYGVICYYFDSTELRNAEQELRESEERFRVITETSPVLISVSSISDGTVLFTNPAYDLVFGFQPGEIIGMPAEDRFYNAAERSAFVDTLRERGEIRDLEVRVMRKDGTPFWVSSSGARIRFGGIEAMLGASVDITNRKLAEEALRESEKRYRTVADFTYDWEFWIDPDGWFVYLSPSAERILGRPVSQYTSAESLFSDVTHPDDLNTLLGHVAQEIAGQGPFDKEFRIVRPDGEVRWIHHVCRPVLDAEGRFLGTRGSNRDITERKQAEEALLRARDELELHVEERTVELKETAKALDAERRRLYDVLETLPVYVCLLDKDYRMPFANRYFREAFGDPKGRRCYDALFNRSEPCETCETYTVMKTGGPHRWFWTGPNGRDYDIYDFPFTDTDGSLMILEMGIDITERKKAEEEWAILASIVEHSEDAIIGKSLEGVIMSWNAGAEKIYGYSAEEAIGRHISMLVPPGEDDDLDNILIQIRKGEPVIHYDTIRIRKDGLTIQVSLTVSPIKDRKGTLIGASTIARDITERRKAGEAIEKANAYNRSLIEASLDPLVTINPDGTISDVNEATIRVTGFSRGELVGTDFSDYFTEPEKAKAGYESVFRDGSVTDYALEIRHRNGQVTPVLYNATVYRDATGNVIGVFAAARDITERRKAEEAIKKANAYNRSLIEASLDPLVTINPDGTISDVNEATIRVTGFSRGELVGTDFSDYFTEPEKAKAGYESVFRDGSVTDYALEIRHRNGHVTPVLYNATVYRDAAGNIIGVFAAARDITERKKAEEALRKEHDLLEKRVKDRTSELVMANVKLREEISQRKLAESLVKKTVSELHAAIESTADGIYVVDRAGRIIRYNQNFASMWKIPDELLQSGEDCTVSGYLRTQVKNPGLFQESDDEQDHPKDRETYDMLELSDGRIFERYSKPQKMDALIIGRVLSYRDVTDRRRAEEKLIASLQEKETLIREIHHRVKNNLQIISGLLDMTRMRTPDSTTHGILTDMMMKIKTMAQIHTRLYESKQFDKINMGSQIRDQVADLSSIYGRSGAEIQSEIDAQDIYLPVDQAIPCALVVNEILSNAFKHAFRGKKHGNLSISATQTDDHVNIIIRDDGVGIPKDVDVSRSTSLGLKLIRNLVLQLNGSVTITSDRGTEVIVNFPLHSGGK